ncbi:unnamed protein product [Strongylus vulgaris]|uniref:Uncharacterized protein n=1 Tax=Strongylus vulgaris TaxID=40348 RepID=A0A3P7JCC9_STRVU|nr:unnamed protein product [Strongylus vulgaris]
MLCTYTARSVSTNADLHAPLEAVGRINYHVIALQTKSRKTDVRQLSDGTLIIRGEKVPSLATNACILRTLDEAQPVTSWISQGIQLRAPVMIYREVQRRCILQQGLPS